MKIKDRTSVYVKYSDGTIGCVEKWLVPIETTKDGSRVLWSYKNDLEKVANKHLTLKTKMLC